MNGRPYVACKDDLCICPPDVKLNNAVISEDFKCYVIVVSINYVQRIMLPVISRWEIKSLFEQKPLFHLEPEEKSIFCQYYGLFHEKVTNSKYAHRKQIIDALMQAFIYELQDTIGQRLITREAYPFTSAENIFNMFIDLLHSTYPKSRSVSFYADRLHITPKYLSTICKATFGQTASKVIDIYVIKDIEYLLLHTRKTIKEICNEMEFPNLSFFGRYVKKHLGASPKVLREQRTNKQQKETEGNEILFD